jgi:hypothetical protein
MVYAAWERTVLARNSNRLGGSIIGDVCPRKIWLSFRWARKNKFDGRMLRLFSAGMIEEARVETDLKKCGLKVEMGPEPGQQFEFTDGSGHIVGKIDGVVLGVPEAPKTWHLLEVKTHNTRSFLDLTARGVVESKPMHWAQMQVYMRLAELDRFLYYAVCKDSDEIYTERGSLDTEAADTLIERALQIIKSDEQPRMTTGDDEECKKCGFKPICWGESVPDLNCRTCIESTAVQGGTWQCELKKIDLSADQQAAGCERHIFIPDMINARRVEESSGSRSFRYKLQNGGEFTNGEGGLASSELVQLTLRGAVIRAAQMVKKQFPGAVVEKAVP